MRTLVRIGGRQLPVVHGRNAHGFTGGGRSDATPHPGSTLAEYRVVAKCSLRRRFGVFLEQSGAVAKILSRGSRSPDIHKADNKVVL
jgi:hypothetical protein